MHHYSILKCQHHRDPIGKHLIWSSDSFVWWMRKLSLWEERESSRAHTLLFISGRARGHTPASRLSVQQCRMRMSWQEVRWGHYRCIWTERKLDLEVNQTFFLSWPPFLCTLSKIYPSASEKSFALTLSGHRIPLPLYTYLELML